MPTAGAVAETYRRFGVGEAAGTLYERVAVAVAGSAEAVRAVEALPARRRNPALVLAALHDLALAGRAPDLAAAYAGHGDAAGAAVGTLVRMTGAVAGIVARRRLPADATGCCAVLYPAVAEAGRRVGADRIGLIDVGSPAGLNLNLDRVGIAYGNGQTLGDPRSPVPMSASVVGDEAVPERAVPEVVARIAVDPDPLDPTDTGDARWLRACVWPDRPDRAARLDAEIALAATTGRLLLRGDDPAEAFAHVPAYALPVVTTTWVLSRITPERRRRFLRRLGQAGRPVAWVSVEGVGVAPSIPTFGDRHASGHSVIGVAVLDGPLLHAEAVGRCWSRGGMLAWRAAGPDLRPHADGPLSRS